VLAYHDAAGQVRVAVGYPGEDGVEAGVTYRAALDGSLEPVPAGAPMNQAPVAVTPRRESQAATVVNLAAVRAHKAAETQATPEQS
jgi:hypothetical protein